MHLMCVTIIAILTFNTLTTLRVEQQVRECSKPDVPKNVPNKPTTRYM
jgi:hypothetical protein